MDTLIRYSDVSSICTRNIYAKSAFIRSIEPKALARLKIMLIDQRINNYYFQ